MPLAWFKDVRVTRRGAITEVRWRQQALDRMGEHDARADPRVSIETRYTLAPGRITRSDRVVAAPGTRIAKVDVEFASFSRGARPDGLSAVSFGQGEVRDFAAKGYGRCRATPAADPVYRAPTGPFATVVRCSETTPSRGPVNLSWTLSYNSRGKH